MNKGLQNLTSSLVAFVVVVCFRESLFYLYYSKTCVNGHSKMDKTKVLVTNGCLLKVESIAECSPFDLHLAIIGLEKYGFESGPFTRVVLYTYEVSNIVNSESRDYMI